MPISAISGFLDAASARTGLPKPVVAGGIALLALAATRTAAGILGDRKIKNTKGLKVFVTGCDTGFGNITAKQLAEKGYTVYAACLTDSGIESFNKLAASDSRYRTIRAVKLDVTKDADVQACRALLEREAPEGLFCLVNNAGLHAAYKWELSPMDMIQKDMEVNYYGVVRVTMAFLPLLRRYVASNKSAIAAGQAPPPRIVTVSSIAGSVKASPSGSYCASKHAAQVFGVTLRQEVAHQGIHVSLIEPYYARTPFLTVIDERKIQRILSQPKEVIEAYGGEADIRKRMSRSAFHTAMPRVLEPPEVMNVMVGQVHAWRPNPHNLVGFESNLLTFLLKIMSPQQWDRMVHVFEQRDM
ncbi:NAD(P)-binding protein [Gonapodya prolifera JEL478]|uniref:NAD(P)-binding protein n=1 Tax=Gonapodya prolifera (strain JEL478) TaxID=1344416 RepID=A0A139ACD3_GONPJ|nr:NAD(P)-binding protein [Gonapodya prolifera JEL478]|eukprot:KXS14083.1 NAD(P)-binding protein [Gonapodya prolifera JEL478]